MHVGKPFLVVPFDSDKNPLQKLETSQQLSYLSSYLIGASAKTVVIEPNYFDRDYLDEFASFYSKSAKGYSNICMRLHFFSEKISTRLVNSAINGTRESCKRLQEKYLGFIVLRPLDIAPMGRTVLSWYKNRDQDSERITPLLRRYRCNFLGVQLGVDGIPWQQQDRGVSACATIALWSMFHSSAFDANHAVPTTAEITNNAHIGSAGLRAFPSTGLSIHQMQEAIFSQKLTPKLLFPTKAIGDIKGFTKGYLASMCAANIRSGYPVLMVGDYIHGSFSQQHAVCCIGFREKEQALKPDGSCSTMDDETNVFYIHDDNIGPNVRCELVEDGGFAVLETSPPSYVDSTSSQPQKIFKFRPMIMLIAVHEEIRMDAESLAELGSNLAKDSSTLLNEAYTKARLAQPAVSYNTQFMNVRDFFSQYLSKVFSGSSSLLGKVRRSIGKDVPPLCLHVGLVSIGICNSPISRVIDVIFDTTDSALNQPVVAHIIYDKQFKLILDQFNQAQVERVFGVQIIGYEE